MTKYSQITRREFGHMAFAGMIGAATVSGNGWCSPAPAPLALLGCGCRGRHCLDALGASDIALVCDVDRTRANALATLAQADMTDHWRQCTTDSGIAGVVVAVPDGDAPEICRSALDNGKRVFLDCSDSTALAALVPILGADAIHSQEVSAVFPWSPAAMTIANLIRKGCIGAVRFGHAGVNGCISDHGADAVVEAHVAQLLFLLTTLNTDAPYTISTVGSPQKHEPYSLLTTLTGSNGLQLNITTSAQPVFGTGVVIRGAHGSIEYKDGGIVLFSDSGTAQHVAIPDMEQARSAALTNWRNRCETTGAVGAVKTINATLQQFWA